MKNIIAKIIGSAIIGICLFVFIKDCSGTIWTSDKETKTYVIHGEDKREITIIFLRSNKAFFCYYDPDVDYVEFSFVKLYGSYGINYFGNLWHVESPNSYFNYHFYPSGTTPIVMGIETKKKFIKGKADEVFPKEGRTSYSIFLFQENKLIYSGMPLLEEPTDSLLVNKLSLIFQD